MDDLTRIKGIGPAAAKRLLQAGIDSFEKLAHDGLAGQHGVKIEWISEAAELLHAAANETTEGKPPRPDEQGGSAEARPIPADSRAGDLQQDDPQSEDRGGEDGNSAVFSREDALAMAALPAEPTAAVTVSDDAFVKAVQVMRGPFELAAGFPDAPDAASAERAARDAAVAQFQADLDVGVPLTEAAAVLAARSAAIRDEFLATRAVELRRTVAAAETTTRDRQTIAAEAVARQGTVIVAARKEGFRRAGMAHPKAPTPHSAAELGVDRLVALLAEPNLTVELV